MGDCVPYHFRAVHPARSRALWNSLWNKTSLLIHDYEYMAPVPGA
jgi:hypothetical protein